MVIGCVIAAQTGIGGSTVLGDLVFVGAQTGIHQHLTIGDRVRIAAKSGVMKSVSAGTTIGNGRRWGNTSRECFGGFAV